MAPSSSQVLSNQVTPFELDRDPEVFDVVVNWMMGYEVFPLTEKGMGSAERKALMYLSKEARFLELPELEEEAEIALRGI